MSWRQVAWLAVAVIAGVATFVAACDPVWNGADLVFPPLAFSAAWAALDSD